MFRDVPGCSMFHVPCSWFYRRPDVLPKILGNVRPRARAFDSARELPNFSQGISAKQKWSIVLKTKIVTAYRARMKLYHETRENGLYGNPGGVRHEIRPIRMRHL